jgi:DNA-binding LacI/PurR family transcriptional regulator
MSVTIRDVARKAGVGVATVSRVINESGLVSPDTRESVLRAISELSYVPNPTARRLSLGRTNTIGVIVPFFTRPSAVERLRGISEVFEGSKYDLVVYNVETLQRRQQHMAEVPRPDRADGVIVISMSPSVEDSASLTRFELPVVLLDGYHPDFVSMIEDSVAGGRMATEHLIRLGHTRIGFIGGPLNDPFNFQRTPSTKRLEGYRQAMTGAGLEISDALEGIDPSEVIGRNSLTMAREFTLQMCSLPNPVTAIVTASDTHAFGVLQAARERGMRVPGDLSLVGYDDIEAAAYVELTTVSQFLYETGKRSAERMLQLLSDTRTETPRFEQLPLEVVTRRTTGPVQSH